MLCGHIQHTAPSARIQCGGCLPLEWPRICAHCVLNEPFPAGVVPCTERKLRDFDKELKAFDASGLNPADALTYRLLSRSVAECLDGYRFRAWLMPITLLEGPQVWRHKLGVRMRSREIETSFVRWRGRLCKHDRGVENACCSASSSPAE